VTIVHTDRRGRSLPTQTPVAVCALEQLHVERGAAALVHGHQVALFRLVDGSVHAIDHRDPAADANVIARGLLGTVGDEWYVASPLHKHRYSLVTGKCLSDDTLGVAVHRVEVEDGTVFVTLAPTS
jgi:nitrite reductase (NADH) small subunit